MSRIRAGPSTKKPAGRHPLSPGQPKATNEVSMKRAPLGRGGPSAFLITLGFIAAGDETNGPPSGATVTAQAAWCDLDVRVGSPLRHLNRSTAPNQAVADDRRRHGQPESTGRPGSASTRPGRDRRRGVRWRGTGGGHRPSVEYAHLSGGIRPWALRYAERDSDRLPNHHESAVGCPTPHER